MASPWGYFPIVSGEEALGQRLDRSRAGSVNPSSALPGRMRKGRACSLPGAVFLIPSREILESLNGDERGVGSRKGSLEGPLSLGSTWRGKEAQLTEVGF